jgi:hypothetical protein
LLADEFVWERGTGFVGVEAELEPSSADILLQNRRKVAVKPLSRVWILEVGENFEGDRGAGISESPVVLGYALEELRDFLVDSCLMCGIPARRDQDRGDRDGSDQKNECSSRAVAEHETSLQGVLVGR